MSAIVIPKFTDWLATKVGTRQWIVADRLSPRMKAKGYKLAIPVHRYHELYEAHGEISASLARSLEPSILEG